MPRHGPSPIAAGFVVLCTAASVSLYTPLIAALAQSQVCAQSESAQACWGGVGAPQDSEATGWVKALTLLELIPGLCLTPLFMSMSAQIGRKTFCMLPLAGFTCSLFNAMCVEFFELNLSWLYAGSFMSGLCGSSPLAIAALLALATDMPAVTRRIKLAMFVGLALGFLVGRHAYDMSQTYDFLLAGLIWLAVNVLMLLFMPETLTPGSGGTKINWRALLPWVHVSHILNSSNLMALVVTLFCVVGDILLVFDFKVFPAQHQLARWTASKLGHFLTLQMALQLFFAAILGWLLRRVTDATFVCDTPAPSPTNGHSRKFKLARKNKYRDAENFLRIREAELDVEGDYIVFSGHDGGGDASTGDEAAGQPFMKDSLAATAYFVATSLVFVPLSLAINVVNWPRTEAPLNLQAVAPTTSSSSSFS